MSPGMGEAMDEIGLHSVQEAIRARDVATLNRLCDQRTCVWDGRTFY